MAQSTPQRSRFSPPRIRRAPLRLLLADDIDGVLREVNSHRTSLSASVPVQRRAVKDARAELTALAMQLRADAAVSSRGLDLTKKLLTDVSGPLYTRGPDNALAEAAREARVALRPVTGR